VIIEDVFLANFSCVSVREKNMFLLSVCSYTCTYEHLFCATYCAYRVEIGFGARFCGGCSIFLCKRQPSPSVTGATRGQHHDHKSDDDIFSCIYCNIEDGRLKYPCPFLTKYINDSIMFYSYPLLRSWQCWRITIVVREFMVYPYSVDSCV
jgi:hypothetical protein